MPEDLVPAVKTIVTPVEMYAALRDASKLVLGAELPRGALLVLLSQWAFETGRGAAMWNFNIGNAKHVTGDGRSFYQIRRNEIIDGKEVWLDPPDPGCSFRAYESLDAGARDYMLLLHSRFAKAWPSVMAGDPRAFALELHNERYYTADPGIYSRNLEALYAEFDRTLPADPPDTPLAVAPIVDVSADVTGPDDLPPAA